jgi:hypothetical protein
MMKRLNRSRWSTTGRALAVALLVTALGLTAISAAPASAQASPNGSRYQYYWYETVPTYGFSYPYGLPASYGFIGLQPMPPLWWNPFYGPSFGVTPGGALRPGYPAVNSYFPVYFGYPGLW